MKTISLFSILLNILILYPPKKIIASDYSDYRFTHQKQNQEPVRQQEEKTPKNPFAENHQSTPLTENIGLSFEETRINLDQLYTEEVNYQKSVTTIIRSFKKKLAYDPITLEESLKRDIKTQKKVLEKKIKQSGKNQSELIEAFKEFNRYLIITLNSPNYQGIINLYNEYIDKYHKNRNTFLSELAEKNALYHLFNEMGIETHESDPVFKAIHSLQKSLQKIRDMLKEKRREKEIFQNEYRGFKGQWHWVRDKFHRNGKYAK